MKFSNLDKILDQIQTVLVPKKDTDDIDVPNVLDLDEPYTTHIQLGEQDEKPEEEIPEETPQEEKPAEKTEEVPQEKPERDNIPGEMPAEEMSAEEMPGMGIEEEPLEISEIGRIYELKKIYTRLTSIESYLSLSSDTILLKLRNSVSQALDLFETLISNIDSYKDDLDNIIIMFYKFLDVVYALLKKYYDIKTAEDEKSNNATKKRLKAKV